MQRSVVLLLAFVCAAASAQVYWRIGPDGDIYFSDQPGPDAEQVHVTPARPVSPPPVPDHAGAPDQQNSPSAAHKDDAGTSYAEFAVVSPAEEEGVRANDGNVTVRLSLEPELMPGHAIVLSIDGEDGEQSKTTGSEEVTLSNLSRGRHTVSARVVDEDGNELIQAAPVSFQVLRVAAGGR